MNKDNTIAALDTLINKYESLSYQDLVNLAENNFRESIELTIEGYVYQTETEILWDNKNEKSVRVYSQYHQ